MKILSVVYCEYCHDENTYCPKCGCHVGCLLIHKLQTCHNKQLASLLLICDGCNKEHHVYCLSPFMETISDSPWYCPECQSKQKDEVILNQCLYKDRNYTYNEKELSQTALSVIEQIKDTLDKVKSSETVDIKPFLQSISVTDLIQVQSCSSLLEVLFVDFLTYSRRLYNRLNNYSICYY